MIWIFVPLVAVTVLGIALVCSIAADREHDRMTIIYGRGCKPRSRR